MPLHVAKQVLSAVLLLQVGWNQIMSKKYTLGAGSHEVWRLGPLVHLWTRIVFIESLLALALVDRFKVSQTGGLAYVAFPFVCCWTLVHPIDS